MRFLQQVISLQADSAWTRGRHLLKFGGLAERYLQDMVNPTFSLGTYSFANLRAFLENRATSFIGLTPRGDSSIAYWPFWLARRLRCRTSSRSHARVTLNAGLRYEFMTHADRHQTAAIRRSSNLTDRTATTGQLYEDADYNNFSPRVGAAWDVTGDGRTSVRGGYGHVLTPPTARRT